MRDLNEYGEVLVQCEDAVYHRLFGPSLYVASSR